MKLLKNILASTLLVSSFASVTPVLADNYDDQVKEATQQAEDNEQAVTSLENIMNQLTDEVTDTQMALNNLAKDIQRNEQFLENAVIELGNAHQEMTTLQDEIAILERNIENRLGQLEEQARKIQVNGTSTTNIDFILSAESLTDVLARIDIVSKVVGTINKMLEDQIEDQNSVIEKTEETERKILQQNAIAEELEKTSADLESQKISQEALVAQLKIEQSTIGNERDELVAQRNEALQRADQIEREREEVRLAVENAEAERQAVVDRPESPSENQERLTRPASSSTASVPAGNSSSQSTANSSTSSNASSNASSSTSSNTSSNTSSSTSSNTNTNSRPTTPAPNPAPKEEVTPAPKPVPAPSGNVLSLARQYIGTPYLYGGTTTSAFDCSGYTRHVFSQAGKNIPRTSSGQYAASAKVSNPQPGDLVFFGSGSVTHVGIYQGGGRFIGSQTSTGVKEESLTTGYWSSRVIGYGRY